MTINDRLYVYRFAVEVAYQISILMDVSGTGEIRRKGVTPKEYISCIYISWAYG